MSDTKKDEVNEEPGAEERFDAALKNALAMPPKPHVKKEPKAQKTRTKKDKPAV